MKGMLYWISCGAGARHSPWVKVTNRRGEPRRCCGRSNIWFRKSRLDRRPIGWWDCLTRPGVPDFRYSRAALDRRGAWTRGSGGSDPAYRIGGLLRRGWLCTCHCIAIPELDFVEITSFERYVPAKTFWDTPSWKGGGCRWTRRRISHFAVSLFLCQHRIFVTAVRTKYLSAVLLTAKKV